MKYKITHGTTYHYDETVPICHNIVRLTPRKTDHQTFGFHRLVIKPHPVFNDRRTDYFGNGLHHFAIEQGHKRLTVTSTSRVEVTPASIPAHDSTPAWEEVRRQLLAETSPAQLAVSQYLYDSPAIKRTPQLAEYARESFPAGRPILAAATDLTRRIHEDFQFDSKATTVHTPLEEVFRLRRGVCQDLTHVQLGCLRSIGVAARYVSGYLRTHPPEGEDRLIGADQSHAWVGVYCGATGWIDLDPTNNSFPSDEHLTLAFGRDYTDVCPIEGVFLGGGSHTIHVSVDVAPITE